MSFVTCDLCDEHPEDVRVCEPLFASFGGRSAFGGAIVTVKCHEDNSLVKEQRVEVFDDKPLDALPGATATRIRKGITFGSKSDAEDYVERQSTTTTSTSTTSTTLFVPGGSTTTVKP